MTDRPRLDQPGKAPCQQATRHPGNSLNFAYVDGHVGSKTANQVWAEHNRGGTSVFFDQDRKF